MSFEVRVEKRLGRRLVAAEFAAGDGIIMLLGASGAGKSSILNMVAGLLRPDRGTIRVGGNILFDSALGVDVPPEHRRLGYIFQDGRLFPHRSVRANLLYGYRRAPREERWMTLDRAIAFLGIGDLLDRSPRSLSGGEQQRVAIGRALLAGARALLMDEPLTALDAERRDEIMTVIGAIRSELKIPILFVTHHEVEAARLGDTVVRLG